MALLSDTRNPGTHAAARLPCKRRGSCPDCGPVTRQAIIRHFLAMMEGHPMRRRRIDPAARRSTLAKLRRAGHQWVPIPAPDGALALYATGGPGDVVDDLEASLTSDVMAAPDGRAITRAGHGPGSQQPPGVRAAGSWTAWSRSPSPS